MERRRCGGLSALARRLVIGAGTVYAALVAGLIVVTWLGPPRAGIPAIAVIFAPHLALAALVLAPLAALRATAPLRLALAVLAAVALARFGDEWLSLPPSREPDLKVGSWNLQLGARAAETGTRAMRGLDADLVALQELTPDQARAIEADPVLSARFPYQSLVPDAGVLGLGLLSRGEMTSHAARRDPPVQVATIDVDGLMLTVVNAHPLPARIRFARGVPVDFDPERRDRDLRSIRARVDEAINRGERVLLIGDFNVVLTEAAWRELTRDLHDAHRAVGLGTGWTWRPARLAAAGVGLLRIDAAFGGPGLVPVQAEVACGLPGDHCQLLAGFAFE